MSSSIVKGRGARSNASGRYESLKAVGFDDGWTAEDEPPAPLRTSLTPERARKIITRNDSPDVGFDRSINPYRGCEHGCIYCYARPAHAWMGLSPGVDFESKLFFKPESARLLEQELCARRYVCKPIHIGGNTDPYQPVERDERITRGVIEVLSRFNHPFSIITKSALIARDVDLMGPMAEKVWSARRCPSPHWTESWPAPWSPARRRRPGGWRPYHVWRTPESR